MRYQNHVIDPTFFYDAIEEFSFDYSCYFVCGEDYDDEGKTIKKYDKKIIRGSLQSKGSSLNQNKTGSRIIKSYEFYCKSLYRLNIGDVIEYKDDYYMVDAVNDYDEFGVRSCALSMIQLTKYKDLKEYIKYLRGELQV